MRNPSPLQGASIENRLLAQPTKLPLPTPETEYEPGDEAKIVLKLHCRSGVGKRGTQIVSAHPDGKRPRDGAFDSAPERIGKSSHGSTQVIGSFDGNRAVYQTDAGQSVHEDPRISKFPG